MNWEAMGAFAELAGAIGVILSLLYLGAQIRNQNREHKLDSVNESTRQWSEFLGSQADNGELAEIWLKGVTDFESLTPLERLRFSSHAGRIVRVLEGLYVHKTERRLEEEAWNAIHRAVEDVFSYPGLRAWWSTRNHWYTDAFRDYMNRFMERDFPHKRIYGEDEQGVAS